MPKPLLILTKRPEKITTWEDLWDFGPGRTSRTGTGLDSPRIRQPFRNLYPDTWTLVTDGVPMFISFAPVSSANDALGLGHLVQPRLASY